MFNLEINVSLQSCFKLKWPIVPVQFLRYSSYVQVYFKKALGLSEVQVNGKEEMPELSLQLPPSEVFAWAFLFFPKSPLGSGKEVLDILWVHAQFNPHSPRQHITCEDSFVSLPCRDDSVISAHSYLLIILCAIVQFYKSHNVFHCQLHHFPALLTLSSSGHCINSSLCPAFHLCSY